MIGAVPGFLRRDRAAAASLEDEREALRRQRRAAAEELERLKRELAERVASVREKERQLDEALRRAASAEGSVAARGPGEPVAAQVAPGASPTPEEQLARIEARLAELREAERVFLRTQEELAARSEALATRERLVAERERELDVLEDRSGTGLTRSELAELEARLRRLETRRTPPTSEETQSFAAGLETLRRRGTRRPPPAL